MRVMLPFQVCLVPETSHLASVELALASNYSCDDVHDRTKTGKPEQKGHASSRVIEL